MTAFKGIALIFFFFSFILASAQDTVRPADLPTWKLKNYVEGYERIGDIYAAIEMAEEFLERRPENRKMLKTIGSLYMRSRDYKSALETYEKLYLSKPDAESHYYYGLMMLRTGSPGKAEEQFNSFRIRYPESSQYAEFYERLDEDLASAKFASDKKPDESIDIVHLDASVNCPHIDFSPVAVNDSVLLYASLRSNEVMLDASSPIKRQFFMGLKMDTATYQSMTLPFDVNDPAFDCGNGAFSPKGDRFYFTKCSKVTITSTAHCEIYVTELKNGKWSEAKKLDALVNSSSATSTHPTIGLDSKGNEVLYFISDREGSVGGLDIWYAVFDARKSAFKAAKNCGKKINSARDEITPWYQSETKTLFFSSEGYPGFGGYDIFSSEGELRKWNTPNNLGQPINSPADDLFYTLKPNRESGFLVSNREGGFALESTTCCDDIYELTYNSLVKITIDGTVAQIRDTTLGPEYASYDTLPEAPATVSLYLVVDGNNVLMEKKVLDTDSAFSFRLQKGNDYQIIAEKQGYLKDSRDISTRNIHKSDTIEADLLNLRQIPLAPIVIKNIYYPFDKDYLTDNSQVIIDTTVYKILTDNPDIIIEIGSHTDALGTDEYNADLSQRRAQSVVNYLIEKGIKPERLTAKGYGESVPIAPNTNEDGSDNPEGRQRNRRTEFRVIGFLPGVSDIIYEE